jgi:hypothetical protein
MAMSDVTQCGPAIDELSSRTPYDASSDEGRAYGQALLDLRLFVARRAGVPMPECEALFQERNALGFRTLSDEVIHLLGHARYCRTMGDREKAAGIATVALAKLEATERGGRAGFGEIEAALRALSR